MAKIPKTPEDIFQEFIHDFKSIFGEDLISIILYGSAARGEYVYKRSDINFLIVITEQGMVQLSKALPLVHKWSKRKVSAPLILTNGYIESSLDSFPIEFLTMKQHHKLVFGEDVLENVEIKLTDLRLQCERELRGKLLHLRENYLVTNGKPREIKNLIRITVPTFVSIFTALLHLKEIDSIGSKKQIFEKTTEVFGLDKIVFEKILQVRENNLKLKKEELNTLIQQYIDQIRMLTNIVDKL